MDGGSIPPSSTHVSAHMSCSGHMHLFSLDPKVARKSRRAGYNSLDGHARTLNRTTFRRGLLRTGDCSRARELINRNEADGVRSSTMMSNIAESRLPLATGLRRRTIDLVEYLDHLAGIIVMSDIDRE